MNRGKLTDVDGIDKPFEQAMDTAIADDGRRDSIAANHPTIESCTVRVFADGSEWWTAVHGVKDDRGRNVGGRVKLEPLGSRDGGYTVRIQATRDGVEFGALRRRVTYVNLAEARVGAEDAIERQRKQYRRKFKLGTVRP